jgi:hypothetical protein
LHACGGFLFARPALGRITRRPALDFHALARQTGKLLAKSKLRFSLVIAAGLKELLPLIYQAMGLSVRSRFLA